MKYTEAKPGRIFVIRLEDGEILHECIEAFAEKKNIKAAALLVLGGAQRAAGRQRLGATAGVGTSAWRQL